MHQISPTAFYISKKIPMEKPPGPRFKGSLRGEEEEARGTERREKR